MTIQTLTEESKILARAVSLPRSFTPNMHRKEESSSNPHFAIFAMYGIYR